MDYSRHSLDELLSLKKEVERQLLPPQHLQEALVELNRQLEVQTALKWELVRHEEKLGLRPEPQFITARIPLFDLSENSVEQEG